MPSSDLYEAQITSENIREKGNKIFEWEWEERFNIITTKITIKKRKKALKILKANFHFDYDFRTIKKAENSIQDIATALGGLRKEQFLFISDSSNKIILFAVWWPWQSNEYISIKIGLINNEDNKQFIEEIRDWFAV